MPRLALAAIALLLASCASTFTDASKLPCKVTHRVKGDLLIVTATVINESGSTVTFVDHPDFYSISVLAVDRSKDDPIDGTGWGLIHFLRATQKNLIRVPSDGHVTFEQSFPFQRKPGGIVEVDSLPCTMRIWDAHLRAGFHYGAYPDYLPKHAWALGTNYVMTELKAEEVFPRP